jgi:hypothetical protein
MNIRHKMKLGIPRGAFAISASVVGFCLLNGSFAGAALISLGAYPAPGDNFTVTPAASALPPGPPIQSHTNNIFDEVNPSESLGSLTTTIYNDGSGDLEFVYQVYNSTATPGNPTAPADAFDTLELSDFGPLITTNVGYNNPGGTVDPSSANRDSSFDLNWIFNALGTVGSGQYSDYLIVDTNATNFQNAMGSVIDDTTGVAQIQGPVMMPGVPEPASIGLLAVVGGMLLGRRRQRRAV